MIARCMGKNVVLVKSNNKTPRNYLELAAEQSQSHICHLPTDNIPFLRKMTHTHTHLLDVFSGFPQCLLFTTTAYTKHQLSPSFIFTSLVLGDTTCGKSLSSFTELPHSLKQVACFFPEEQAKFCCP